MFRFASAIQLLASCLLSVAAAAAEDPIPHSSAHGDAPPGPASWTASAPMHVRKAHLDTTALNGTIFAVGGENGTDEVATVQMFDGKAWTAGPSLIEARSSVGVAALGSKIYAVGGWSSAEQKALATVELLDAVTLKRWVAGPTMRQGRNGLKIAALGGKLYAVGGANTKGDNLRTVEVLDADGTGDGTAWAAAPSMNVSREGHGVAVLGGKLYAVGGLSDDAAPMTSMEIYDPRTRYVKTYHHIILL